MKSLFIIFSILFVQISSVSMAQAQGHSASIVFQDGSKTTWKGHVDVNLEMATITVSIWDKICPEPIPGELSCLSLPELIGKFEVPLKFQGSDCGSVIYEGLIDKRMVDGNMVQITVKDNTNRKCRDMRDAQVEATVKVIYGWNAGETSFYLLSNPYKN